MTLEHLLATYTTYNVWANERIINLIKKNIATFEVETANSFSTIKTTLIHIWGAEYAWYERLHGVSIDKFPSESRTFSAEEVFEAVRQHSKKFNDFVTEKSENDVAFLQSYLEFNDSLGQIYNMPVFGMIQHCMNHSTYHRGQIITMLRTLGAKKMVSTDLITYLRLNA